MQQDAPALVAHDPCLEFPHRDSRAYFELRIVALTILFERPAESRHRAARAFRRTRRADCRAQFHQSLIEIAWTEFLCVSFLNELARFGPQRLLSCTGAPIA